MKTEVTRPIWLYGLLLVPVFSAIMALRYYNFIFKAGVAASGMVIILLCFFLESRRSKDVLLVVVAFLFSIAGDWFLSTMHGDTGRFIAGIGFFFLAHAGYLSYALLNGRFKWTVTIVFLTGYLLFFLLKLFPVISDSMLMLASLLYLLISCFSLGAAAGMRYTADVKWAFLAGIILILFSDTIIALKEFAGYREMNFLILPTYYLSQISIVYSVLRRMQRFRVSRAAFSPGQSGLPDMR